MTDLLLDSTILVAEDRDDDVLLLRRAFERLTLRNPIHFVLSGEEAISYLKGEAKFVDRSVFPIPWLLLLDVKMPGRDGFEVLQWTRSQPELTAIKVVMLTASDQIRDISKAYRFGADTFLVKPIQVQDLMNLTMAFRGKWHFGGSANWFDQTPSPPAGT